MVDGRLSGLLPALPSFVPVAAHPDGDGACSAPPVPHTASSATLADRSPACIEIVLPDGVTVRVFVQMFDGAGNVRADITGDVLASITTMLWNGPAKGWNARAPTNDAKFNRRQTIRVGASVSYAQVGMIGFDGPIDL